MTLGLGAPWSLTLVFFGCIYGLLVQFGQELDKSMPCTMWESVNPQSTLLERENYCYKEPQTLIYMHNCSQHIQLQIIY